MRLLFMYSYVLICFLVEKNEQDGGLTLEMRAALENWADNHYGELSLCEHVSIIVYDNNCIFK